MNRNIIMLDTTLRDGEQVPGAKLNVQQKVEFAQQLKRLQVDIIEAGFPASSQGDFQAVQEIARSVGDSVSIQLSNVELREVTIADGSFHSTLVPNGKCYKLANRTLSTP